MQETDSKAIGVGVRITVRGEDFIVEKVEDVNGQKLIHAEGLTELVRNQKFIFDSSLDEYEIIDPTNTKLEADESRDYIKSKLAIETHLRNAQISSDKIEEAHKAAINPADYQLEPTFKAFKLPRPRILIADAVGLGKTIEAGILLTELMKRGRAKRILVVALKSILGQFQQEIWNRFAIPLMRIDSTGIARIKAELPANKNPFDYYDKTIISIDTLKNNQKFRHHLEKTHWDVIVIDECHTVANIKSQRGNLAYTLSKRCESLVLTSATPHNGKKENFANLIRMIEPTAIPKYGDFSKEDIQNYFVRRFKKDIHDQVRENFSEREIKVLETNLDNEEEKFLKQCRILREKEKDNPNHNSGNLLFSSLLFKSYLSSPEATQNTLFRRINKLDGEGTENNDEDILYELKEAKGIVDNIIAAKKDTKYKKLTAELAQLKWKGQKNDPRIIIFAERVDTLKSLEKRLKNDYNLDENTVKRFDGSLSDTEQQELIDDFGREDSKIRILLSSDAGSMGVNLHYYCNIMINYDIPWSIITLDQRNGRIDRYGQTKTPVIYYLIGTSNSEGLQTDLHIIKNIVNKEEEVYNSLGDAGTVMQLYDPDKETLKVEKALINENEDELEADDFDPLRDILGDESKNESRKRPENAFASPASFFQSDYNYYESLVQYLKGNSALGKDKVTIENGVFEVKNDNELNPYLFNLPPEATPREGDQFKLTNDKEIIQRSIDNARKKQKKWPIYQMLYDMHPLVKIWMNKMIATLPKDTAPVAKINLLPENSIWYIFHTQISNHIGQSLLSDFFVLALTWEGNLYTDKIYDLKEFIGEYNLEKRTYEQEIEKTQVERIQNYLPEAIEFARHLYVKDQQEKLKDKKQREWEEYKDRLDSWMQNSKQQLEMYFEESDDNVFFKNKKRREFADIETIANKTSKYFRDLTEIDNEPFIQVLGVFFNTDD